MLVRSEIDRLMMARDFARHPYTWPGGYPRVLVTATGGCLCANCTKSEWKLICAESFENTNSGFRISGVAINWENTDLTCDHCHGKIESAYGGN